MVFGRVSDREEPFFVGSPPGELENIAKAANLSSTKKLGYELGCKKAEKSEELGMNYTE